MIHTYIYIYNMCVCVCVCVWFDLSIYLFGSFCLSVCLSLYIYIAEHLINNRDCASSYSVDLLTILSGSHSHFRLKILETIHILTHKPSLCKQRECLLGLNLITIEHSPPRHIFFLTLQSLIPLFCLNRCPSSTVTR